MVEAGQLPHVKHTPLGFSQNACFLTWAGSSSGGSSPAGHTRSSIGGRWQGRCRSDGVTPGCFRRGRQQDFPQMALAEVTMLQPRHWADAPCAARLLRCSIQTR